MSVIIVAWRTVRCPKCGHSVRFLVVGPWTDEQLVAFVGDAHHTVTRNVHIPQRGATIYGGKRKAKA